MEHEPITSVLTRHKIKRSDIATALGVDKATVTRWFKGRFPAERAVEVEKAMGIPRAELRPDIFGPGQTGAA